MQHHASSPLTRHHFKGENADGGEDGEHIDEDHDVEAVSSDVVANPKNMPETLPEDLNLKWVVARYSDQRNAKKFVGQVLETQDNKGIIKFLKKVEFGKFVWPDIDDIDSLDRSCVIKVLSEPQMDRRSRIAFLGGLE